MAKNEIQRDLIIVSSAIGVFLGAYLHWNKQGISVETDCDWSKGRISCENFLIKEGYFPRGSDLMDAVAISNLGFSRDEFDFAIHLRLPQSNGKFAEINAGIDSEDYSFRFFGNNDDFDVSGGGQG